MIRPVRNACAALILCAFTSLHVEAQVVGRDEIIEGLDEGTRGIEIVKRPAADASRPPANATPAVMLNVKFALNSADLLPEGRQQLDELGYALQSQRLKSASFEVSGHTDARGDADYNLALSRRRAEAAKAYLMKHYSIESHRLITVGFGEQRLALPADPENPGNRRVEVRRVDSPTP
jgi:OmpA-OmpF porin, OOP family